MLFIRGTIFGLIVAFLFSFGFNLSYAVTCPEGNWDNSTGVCIPTNTGLPDAGGGTNPVSTVIINVMQWLLRIIGVVAVIAFVVSGIQYLTSAGNESQIETAKKSMLWSIVGVIVALSGLVILGFVDNMLSNGSYGNGGSGAGSGSGGQTTSGQNSSGSWINPDTGQPFNGSQNNDSGNAASIQRGGDIVNSAINNNTTTVPNSPLDTGGLPVE